MTQFMYPGIAKLAYIILDSYVFLCSRANILNEQKESIELQAVEFPTGITLLIGYIVNISIK